MGSEHRAELAQVPKDLLDAVWPMAEPFMARAYAKLGYDRPDDTRQRLDDGKCDLWLAHIAGHLRAACITSVRGATFNIECLAGDGMTDWLHLIGDLERMAREHGLTTVQADGRPGWAEALRGHGYRTERVVMRKEL